jgi:hypothetical protein
VRCRRFHSFSRNFAWNLYGADLAKPRSPATLASGVADNDIARLLHVPVVASRAVLEGGGYDSNAGVLMGIADTARQRNPGMSLGTIDSRILDENYRILEAATHAQGRHFRVIRVTTPDLRLLWSKPVLRGTKNEALYRAAGFKNREMAGPRWSVSFP